MERCASVSSRRSTRRNVPDGTLHNRLIGSERRRARVTQCPLSLGQRARRGRDGRLGEDVGRNSRGPETARWRAGRKISTACAEHTGERIFPRVRRDGDAGSSTNAIRHHGNANDFMVRAHRRSPEEFTQKSRISGRDEGTSHDSLTELL